MKRAIVLSVAVVLLALIVLGVFINSDTPPSNVSNKVVIDDGAFYVGVTYCGNSTSEAKLLIDKVKNYTNLFVLQSGTLQNDTDAINEVGDYAVNSGLHFIAFFGTGSGWLMKEWCRAGMTRAC